VGSSLGSFFIDTGVDKLHMAVSLLDPSCRGGGGCGGGVGVVGTGIHDQSSMARDGGGGTAAGVWVNASRCCH